MACTIDESALPILTGCPGNNELIVVAGAVGGLDANDNFTTGYARRRWQDLAACAVQAINYFFKSFVIGQSGSPMNPGDTVLTLTYSSLGIISIVTDSVSLALEGSVLPRNDNTQVSYTVAYNPTNVIITFNQGVANNQSYILSYAYTS